jgi:hypothetical protein
MTPIDVVPSTTAEALLSTAVVYGHPIEPALVSHRCIAMVDAVA